jgi:hypothetical protein
MNMEKEHEYWNMEREKLILVRSTPAPPQKKTQCRLHEEIK